MIKTAVLVVTNALLKTKGTLPKRRADVMGAREISVEHKYDILEDKGFDDRLKHKFAMNVRAQELPIGAFKEVLTVGNKNVVSWFFEMNPHKGDLLNDEQISFMLTAPGLRFIENNHHFVQINSPMLRALRIIRGHANFTAGGLARLALDKNCAMALIALMPEQVLDSERVIQATAWGSTFRPADIKRYCRNPLRYTTKDGRSISEIDLIIMRTMAQSPGEIIEILERTPS